MSWVRAVVAVALAAGYIGGVPAAAAEFGTHRIDDDFVVITLVGKIVAGDAEKFDARKPNSGSVHVLLSSPGGSVSEALAIGNTIRREGNSTIVPDQTTCASACALIWLAGAYRGIVGNGRVCFHAVSVGRDRVISSDGNAAVGHYVAELGYDASVARLATVAAPDDEECLTESLAAITGIEYVSLPPLASRPHDANKPPESGYTLEDMARATVRAYFIESARNGALTHTVVQPNALAERYYGDVVDYFGTSMRRVEVADSIRKYLSRWPISVATPTSIDVRCGTTSCVVDGEAIFRAESVERNVRSEGSTRFRFDLNHDGRRLEIVSQSGDVIHRNTSHIDTQKAALIASIQRELTRHRCNPGEVDGAWGPRSSGALNRFAARARWSGGALRPSKDLLSVLRRTPGSICTVN